MGQKIHPHGLRVGIHKKWSDSWLGVEKNTKNFFLQQRQIENIFKAIFYFYSYTKISATKKILLVDIKFFKNAARQNIIFVFFYKMRTKRRKQFVKKIKKSSISSFLSAWNRNAIKEN